MNLNLFHFVPLFFFIKGVLLCSRRSDSTARKPKVTRPPWFDISSFGRYIDTTCACGSTERTPSKFTNQNKTVVYDSVKSNEYPWIVYIKVTIEKEHDYRGITGVDGSYDCSGSLINDRFILTSAQCVYQYDPSKNSENDLTQEMKKILPHQVKVWVNKIDKPKISSVGFLELEKIICHPEFPYHAHNTDSRKSNHDIALLQLKKQINFQEDFFISPVCVPNSDFRLYGNINTSYFDYQPKKVIGWLSTENYLKSFKLNTASCPYEEDANYTLDLRNYYCPSNVNEPFSQYPMMNYGSPMIHKLNEHPRIVQFGILSWVLQLVVRRGKFRSRHTKLRLFTNIMRPEILSFIDYHSFNAKARWCSESVDTSVRKVGHLKNREQKRRKMTHIQNRREISGES